MHLLGKKCPYSKLFWSVFSHIRTKYGEILRISPYSVQMRGNTDQNNSEYAHFLRSDFVPLNLQGTNISKYSIYSKLWTTKVHATNISKKSTVNERFCVNNLIIFFQYVRYKQVFQFLMNL